MLQLQSRKYQNVYGRSYYYTGQSTYIECGSRQARLQPRGYTLNSPSYIMHLDLPLKLNNINTERGYFGYDLESEHLNEQVESIRNKLLNIFNETTEDKFIILTGYVSNVERTEFIDTDIWSEITGDGIKSLYNKCVEQTSLRETERQQRTIQQHIRIFKAKAKHIILLVTDYQDIDQESETILTIGLTPVFYPDWKERFEELELEYFKCLVNRSQVKRISNVKPTNLFHQLEELEKYRAVEREIRYRTLFEHVAQARISCINRQLDQYKRSAENAIQTYDQALKKVNEFEIIINKYKEGTSDIVEELKAVSKMNGVYDVDLYGSEGLKLIFRVPLDYFDEDEAECAIRNIPNEDVKRFLTEVFIEQKYKLFARVDAFYSYSTDDNFRDFSRIDETDYRQINALFNPHFQFYHCLGDYKPSLVKALREQDLTLYTNIALAASRSINFKDGAVMNRFREYLQDVFRYIKEGDNDYYSSMKCLEKDGKLYSLGQWLNNNFDEETNEVNVIEVEDL